MGTVCFAPCSMPQLKWTGAAVDWRATCPVTCDSCLKSLLAKWSWVNPDSSVVNKTVASTAEQKSLEANLRLGCLLGTTGSQSPGGCWVIEIKEPGPEMYEAVTSLWKTTRPIGETKRTATWGTGGVLVPDSVSVHPHKNSPFLKVSWMDL